MMEAIILAGGKGTRLQSVVNDVPKPMASVSGIPFLTYLLQWLKENCISRTVLSVGYKNEVISDYYETAFKDMELKYSVENIPLGTGGAIVQSLGYCDNDDVLVLNGDSFFDVDVSKLMDTHIKNNAGITISLKEMYDFERYGAVKLDGERVDTFLEKKHVSHGYINGGVYAVKRALFNDLETMGKLELTGNLQIAGKFSFEELMQEKTRELNIYGVPFQGHFIDIGIPEDYDLAQTLIPEWVKL